MLLWIAFCVAEGMAHAAVFAHGNTRHPEGYQVHYFLLPIRGLGLLGISLNLIGILNPLQFGIWILAALLQHSFWHNGAYYQSRRHIDSPQFNFFSHSKNSTASCRYTAITRSLMAAGGLFLLFTFI